MQDQQAALQARRGPNFYRTTARVVGAVYLAGFVVGIGGTYSSSPFLARRIAFRQFPQTA